MSNIKKCPTLIGKIWRFLKCIKPDIGQYVESRRK